MQIKKALTSIMMAGVFLLSASAVYATGTVGSVSDNTCSGCVSGVVCPDVCPGIGNYTTGPDSTNENYAKVDLSDSVVVENIANAYDDMRFSVDTGCGEIDNNTVVESVTGGDIDGSIIVMQDLNSGHVVMPAGYGQTVVAPMNMANAVTGPNSTNINKAIIKSGSSLSVINQATYAGNYNFDLNTGGVNIGNNTVVGNVSTGDVDLRLTENVSLNRNASNIILPSSPSAIVIPDMANATTGPGSTNKNSFVYKNENETTITNTADISNNVNADINTGGNTISGNTCVGNVSTGSVRFNVNISSSAN